MAKGDKQISAILLEDESLLQQIREIRDGRKDGTATKTVKDLLRERITEIRVNGDPARVVDAEASAA